MQPAYVAGVDVGRQPLVRQPSVTSSQLLRFRLASIQPSVSSYGAPTTEYFIEFVTELLGRHLRRRPIDGSRADLADACSPLPDLVFSHLVEIVVRAALRQNWDPYDAAGATRRIHQMMLQPNSLLVHVAKYSALEFVCDQGICEKFMSIGDVPRRLTSTPSVPAVDWLSDSYIPVDISSRRTCK